jgi:hypothetical protein
MFNIKMKAMKNFKNAQVYDCPKVEPIELNTESTILDTSDDEGQMTPKPFDPIYQ